MGFISQQHMEKRKLYTYDRLVLIRVRTRLIGNLNAVTFPLPPLKPLFDVVIFSSRRIGQYLPRSIDDTESWFSRNRFVSVGTELNLEVPVPFLDHLMATERAWDSQNIVVCKTLSSESAMDLIGDKSLWGLTVVRWCVGETERQSFHDFSGSIEIASLVMFFR